MANAETIVIIGAGPAGGQAALTLRHSGFKGRIRLIGAEQYLPYERPPLSKDMLFDKDHNSAPLLPGSDHLEEQNIEFVSANEVIAINREAKTVTLADDSQCEYDKLLITTGARVRKLDIPGADRQKVLYLRSFDDSMALKSQLRRGARLVVIGGGFIGLEAASSARKIGCDVTVVEATTQLMGRVVPAVIADFFTLKHREEGVDVQIGAIPISLEGGESVAAVQLADGRSIAADVVLIGIGVIPNVELAEQAGLRIDNGIVVDEQCRTSDPSIFAAGDVTRHYNSLLGKSLRLEAWQAAINQASIAAEVMAGGDSKYAEVPWVWTDQHDVNMQIAGHVSECDELAVRGDPEQCDFTVFQLLDGQVVGVITINRGSEMSVAKRAISSGHSYTAEELTDESVKLRKVLKR